MKYGKNQWARISSLLIRKTPKQCKVSIEILLKVVFSIVFLSTFALFANVLSNDLSRVCRLGSLV